MVLFSSGFAQITSGSLEGQVSNNEDQPVPFANVLAIHSPTGTEYGTTSMDNGRYVLDNLKPGGPYTIKVSYVGFAPLEKSGIYISLGKARQLSLQLKPNVTQLGTVVIEKDVKDRFNNGQSGISSNLSEDQLQQTPTLNRSLQDLTRLVPQGEQSSFGGANYRYNNLSIDGASNNDVLGFQEPASGAAGSVASGTPGALAGTQPISLDAIQEVQVSIAPFDVQQGNFTGASLNAVTRSGTNNWEGSVYFFGRNQNLTGKSVDENREPVAGYHDFQGGVRIGGPILKNKLFAFFNYEKANRVEPVLNAPGTPGSNIPFEVAQAVSDTLQARYNYFPGGFDQTTIERNSDKLFFRLDYNINNRHQLIIRDNYVEAFADNLDRGSNFLNYESQGYRHHSVTNSLVGELKSRLGNNMFNHLILGYNTVNDNRTYSGEVFPHLEITYNSANTLFAGTYREASIYGLTLKTTQFTDNLKIYRGRHTITLGTNNDLYNIQYRFLTAWNGRWAYRSVDDFFNDQPSRVRGVYNYADNSFSFNKNNPSADFRVMLLSAYVQDQYRFSDRLTLTAGVRFDMQLHPDKIPANPDIISTPEFFRYHNDFGGTPQANPRVAFTYQLDRENHMQVRGGSGLFSGRIPFAWYAYAHYISGLNYGNIDLRPTGPLPISRDLSDLQEQQPNLTEINLVDDDFQLPRNWRSSLAIDWKLAGNTVITLEGMYSRTLKDIWFRSINLRDETQNLAGADNRPYYSGSGDEKKVNPNFTNVFLLTNTDKGRQYFVTASVKKEVSKNLKMQAAYTYGKSMDIMNGVRNSMAANFNWNQVVNSNNPDLAFSNFDIRHRVVSSLQYSLQWTERHRTSINLVYTGRSGSPYSYTVAGDVNGDGSSKNDLFFVPQDQSQIALQDIRDDNGEVLVSAEEQWRQLDAYIENDDYLRERRGKYAERNGARTPWNHLLDLRLAHQMKIGSGLQSHHLEFTLDIINFMNLLNYRWGHQTFVPNVQNASYQLIDFEGIENDRATYQFNNPKGTPWQVDALNSRWQAQIGLRYSF